MSMKKLLIAVSVLALLMASWSLWERDWLNFVWHFSLLAAYFFIIPREAKTPKPMVVAVSLITLTSGSLVVGRWIWQQMPN